MIELFCAGVYIRCWEQKNPSPQPSNHNILANNEWLCNIGENRGGVLCMLKEDLTAKMTFEQSSRMSGGFSYKWGKNCRGNRRMIDGRVQRHDAV